MKDEGDHCRTDAIENRSHPRQAAEMHIERTECRDHDEIRQDERPPTGPRRPEAAFHVRDEDADLDRERSRQRLRDGDGVAHLLFAEPMLLLHQLLLHEATERDWTSEA